VKPDLLDGLTPRQRIEREIADKQLIDDAISAGRSAGGDAVIVGFRVDLEHPKDPAHVAAICADCDADLQVLPNLPSALATVCICCAARRIQEGAGQ
jgi:hypothetical protein